jgi:cytochrome P450
VSVLFATRPLWMILGYDAVKRAMTDEEHLSTTEAYKRSLGLTMGPVMATMSGKAHRKSRGVISAVFFPSRGGDVPRIRRFVPTPMWIQNAP